MLPLRFLHIPKTAGTTFAQILEQVYRGEKKFQFTGNSRADIDAFNSMSSIQQQQVKLYTGHAPIHTSIKFIDQCETITLLRDPISRVKSFCQHVSEGKSAYLRMKFPPENFDLDKFLHSEILELHNLQTKMLVNTGASAVNFQMPADEALRLALGNLFNHISVFGLLEHFDESLILFKQKFNWDLPTYTISNTKDKDRLLHFEKHHIDRIIAINQLDIELYQRAKIHFEAQINADEFDTKALHRFQQINHNQNKTWLKLRHKGLNFIEHVYQKLFR
ncbi:MAG TPA: hypothetical protein ENJ44_08255 [Oceanospirillales bacterium]|nr:hypothetical protein [Oceanospirillales bacterium]